MKKFQELTDEQLYWIAKHALADVANWNFFVDLVHENKTNPIEFRVTRENWNGKPPLEVIRLYLHGSGDTYCAIWEVDNPNRIDITVYDDKEVAEVANIVTIIKQLIEWGFV